MTNKLKILSIIVLKRIEIFGIIITTKKLFKKVKIRSYFNKEDLIKYESRRVTNSSIKSKDIN